MTGNPLKMCLIVKIKYIYIPGVSLNLDFSGLKTGRSINLCVFYALTLNIPRGGPLRTPEGDFFVILP